jgi:prevent-host-death family protein
MRSIAALDVRRRFGEIVDRAAAGERIVIERAGRPVAALVPLEDLALVDPERRKAARLTAIDDIRRMARRDRGRQIDAARLVRDERRRRERQITKSIRR